MRFVLASAVVLGLLFTSIPTAAAEAPSFDQILADMEDFGSIDIEVGSKAIAVSWSGIQLGGNTSNFIRDRVDGLSGGDRDGVVDEDEARSAVLMIREFVKLEFDRYSNDHAYSGLLLIDTTEAQGAEVTDLIAPGIEGEVNSSQPISLSFTATVGFPTRPADVHTIKLDIGQYYFRAVNTSKAKDTVGGMSLVIGGAEGWAIDASSIQPDCAAERFNEDSGEMEFTADDLNCFTGRSGVLLTFSITGHDNPDSFSIPGFGLPAAILGLVGLLVVLRRR